jgi:hypothetical protein
VNYYYLYTNIKNFDNEMKNESEELQKFYERILNMSFNELLNNNIINELNRFFNENKIDKNYMLFLF